MIAAREAEEDVERETAVAAASAKATKAENKEADEPLCFGREEEDEEELLGKDNDNDGGYGNDDHAHWGGGVGGRYQGPFFLTLAAY